MISAPCCPRCHQESAEIWKRTISQETLKCDHTQCIFPSKTKFHLGYLRNTRKRRRSLASSKEVGGRWRDWESRFCSRRKHSAWIFTSKLALSSWPMDSQWTPPGKQSVGKNNNLSTKSLGIETNETHRLITVNQSLVSDSFRHQHRFS